MRAAEQPDEVAAVEQRFQDAVQRATSRGTAQVLQAFMDKVDTSQAAIARPLGDVERLASSDKQGYATYYQLIDAEMRVPDDDVWDILRRGADEALFPGQKEKIRFAALTLTSLGPVNYGACSMTLRTEMIAHRTTVFEENTAIFMKQRDVKIADAPAAVRGYRARWQDRAKLCAAKLCDRLASTTTEAEFPDILLLQGATSADDRFVEAHVWGAMTIRAFEHVAVVNTKRRGKRKISKTILTALQHKLSAFGVKMTVIE